ncbi:arf-GAP with Rho-GAP domain, ANK repeat and PH domain-containing protein 1-like isoform X1 [Takifugu flavidus]|uniref:arf-GAP with Rho-GAP domain, ANK repeat and PH domain-containing protein 1-like isoform X1 n=2 Tax=Takifugu flavidus TaxID=433684 RepID=UPI0025449B8C|nr:arf-GAP with Rho-GAP domain, ANK repeat and PH domain-containing protein 1-like isoform X1 [Takifugu flavidus]XP_056904540.1 arf-GAP with Rho-GAP domain, ANK repeat and PH domain-containing protein 1-like isoform X1 [Takifugu flavidus]
MSELESVETVPEWLHALHLEQYWAAFQRAGLATLHQCRSLSAGQLECMGITLPGHRRRILSSLFKTHGIGEPGLRESNPPQCVAQTGYVIPGEENSTHKEGEERYRETLSPSDRRQKPLPRARQVSRVKEEPGDGAQHKPMPRPRRMPPTIAQKGSSVGGVEQPVPKERTKFCANVSSPTVDASLPPIPQRRTPNCPPVCFTSHLNLTPPNAPSASPDLKRRAPVTRGRVVSQSLIHTNKASDKPAHSSQPGTLSLQPPTGPLSRDGGRRTLATPSRACPSTRTHAPPLPPKAGVTMNQPSIPQCVGPQPPTRSRSSTQADGEEQQMDQISQVPTCSRTNQSQENTKPPTQPQVAATTETVVPAICRSGSPPSLDPLGMEDYEGPGTHHPQVDRVNTPDREMSLRVPGEPVRRFSLCSDDGLLGDDVSSLLQEEGLRKDSFFQQASGRLPPVDADDSSELPAVIKMGWLDKNQPTGVLIYQKRWVKLDPFYLRYFDNEKEVYSKGFISTAFITNVSSVGELKFEVATNNRTFTFRAESDVERGEWVVALEDCIGEKQQLNAIGASVVPHFEGFLEHRGLRSKIYTVVLSDKVFLFKNMEDYRIGVGITSIEMNVANVKKTDRRSFEVITPYRLFSFIAESEQLCKQWVDAMQNAVHEALSNCEVAEQIWAEPSNSFCADCGTAKPEWAAINLCVVICNQCAGEHRGLGPSISKVRSLKMDRKIWTEELLQVFLSIGNGRANSFWAANVPPSEALTPSSCREERRHFISNKYRQGKYRKYHALFGNQKELNNALCINVQCSDLQETLSLIFCGADVNCSTGVADWSSPMSLAAAHSQPLQAELLRHNLNTEFPRSEVAMSTSTVHYSAPPSVSLNGFLFKTGSMTRVIADRKGREEFSRRWCTLNDGVFSYYESDRNSTPNGALKASEIACLAVDTPKKHGYNHTFEVYSERLYLFGTDDPESHKEWVNSIAKSLLPAAAEPLLRLNFERIGRLRYKGLNLQTSKVGWFALVGSTLHAYLSDSPQGEEIQLRKLNELSTQQDVLVLVEKGRTLYIEGEKKLAFASWCAAIQAAAGSGGDSLSQQQLIDTDIPVIVNSCISYITQFGMTSEGIYRKSGVTSRVTALLEQFRTDARSQCLREGVNLVDDVSSTLKRFFRELEDGLFTSVDAGSWLSTAAARDESQKVSKYKVLLDRLPRVNKATLQALINHLYCVQCFSQCNQMNIENLAMVFGPTLFKSDGQDSNARHAIVDLIHHYKDIFEVDEGQLKKQLEEITLINHLRSDLNFPRAEPGGDFICTVYLEEKSDMAAQTVRISGTMTAAELTCQVLDLRNIHFDKNDYWSCWVVNEKEEIERPVHYQERVLLLSCETDAYLLIKKHLHMEAMTNYLATKVLVSKTGTMKYREERNLIISTGFHSRYFILDSRFLKMFKDVRKDRAEQEWEVKTLKIHLGMKKKLRPPTRWGMTVVCEKTERQQWYLCCESQSDLTEWYATFLSIQHDGDLWPKDGIQNKQMNRALPDKRLGSVSLIPLRGSENEMRNSVAAFSQDPLSLFRDAP